MDEGPKPMEIDYEENSDLKPYNSEPILCCCSCFGLFKWKKETELKETKKTQNKIVVTVANRFLNKT